MLSAVQCRRPTRRPQSRKWRVGCSRQDEPREFQRRCPWSGLPASPSAPSGCRIECSWARTPVPTVNYPLASSLRRRRTLDQ
ncbi:hypothetical protein NDU88_005016 [Pleurodeles waltl]|uniref:Uncharacterized protein n=1 Tax=Pleurodeles waltl TaxID=8319 RepID=A0AAV7UGW4_PLEWA|nr:hypothetical protein NDU88_005016 [Pleurodeles waltl]